MYVNSTSSMTLEFGLVFLQAAQESIIEIISVKLDMLLILYEQYFAFYFINIFAASNMFSIDIKLSRI